LNLPGVHAQILKLKKERLCQKLLSYIKLLLQFQREEIEGLNVPLRKQNDFKFKHSISAVEDDLDFELECLQIYKEFVLYFETNAKWITTLQEDQQLLHELRSSAKATDDQGRDSVTM